MPDDRRSDEVAQRPVPLDYHAPERRPLQLSSEAMAKFVDGVCIGLALSLVLIVPTACKINIREAPMNGGGSSYTDWALCNEQWTQLHPRFAAFIVELPVDACGCPLLLVGMGYVLSGT